MGVLTQPATSTQPVQQQINALAAGVSYDPSGDPLYMAFVPQPTYGPVPNVTSEQWNTAYWEVDPGPVYWASCLVGPANGGVVLAQGSYLIAVKITDDPAVPVLWGWVLVIS